MNNHYQVALMSELWDRVNGAKIFTKLDLKDAYYLVHVKKRNEWKTAIRIH